MEIKFVSYTGEYPCLCMGILTLLIDGREVTFGYQDGCDYHRFWGSGGEVWFDGEEYQKIKGPWKIYPEDLPDFLRPEVGTLREIINSQIPEGCCGGCS